MKDERKPISIFGSQTKSFMMTLFLMVSSVVYVAYAQQKNVTGTIIDGTGEPVIGASVVVKGTTNGIITDFDGNYTLSVNDGDILQVSFVGYIPVEVRIDGRSEKRILLREDTKLLDEVVVVGYGTQKKSDVTGAMVRVGAEELTSRPVNNAFEAMQGRAAGVDITTNERPGELGNITIRGVRSLSASNEPLYVVDGIPLMSASGIETINPQDIEAIDVLKDASATAIYGSRGANGVVLVTTKRGKEGRFSVNYSGTMTVETLQDRQKMMSAGEYIEWRRWAYYNSDPANYPRGDQPTQANDYVIFLGGNDPYTWANIMKGWEGGTWNGSNVETTDWEGMVTRTGISHEHSLSVSGGSDKLTAYASFGYLKNEGTLKGQDYQRYTAKLSMDAKPHWWLELGGSVSATYSDQQYGQSTTGGQTSGPGSIYAAAQRNLPYAVPYDNEGNRIIYPGGDDAIKTVVNEWNYTDNQRLMFRALGSFYAQLNLWEGLKYRFNFGPDFRHWRNGIYIDSESVNRTGSPNYVSLENRRDFSWTIDNLLYYDKEFGKHKIGVTALQTASSWNYETSKMAAIGIPLASQKWNALNKTNVTLDDWDSNFSERQLMSYMLRVNYGFSEKYLATISGRWDGASQLAAGHKWAFFPSAALAWRIDQEDFLKEIGWISQMKLRVGVGVTGNSAVDPYQTQGLVHSLLYPYGGTLTSGYAPYEPVASATLIPLPNKELTWEKTTQYNIGIDYSFLNGRLSGILDVYTSRTKDLLMQMTIPALTGYTTTWANVGETKNVGVDITINSLNIKTKDFTWETSLNLAWQKDEIVSLANGKQDDISNTWFIGNPIGYTLNGEAYPGVIYNYESAGIWQEEDRAEMEKFNANGHSFEVGMSRPVDQNGDYRIDPNEDRVIIGHTRPRWTAGMTNTFTWKGVELSILLYGRFGYTYNTGGEWQGGRYTQRSISYWTENNTNADYQKPIYNVAGGDPYHSILGYKNGSFIKIRNISVGYHLPRNLIRNWGIESLKVYVQAKNPGMLYSKIDWIDMDTQSSTYNRGFTFGLNVGF